MKSLKTKILTLLFGSVIAAAVCIGGAGIISARQVLVDNSDMIMNLLCSDTAKEIDIPFIVMEQAVRGDYNYIQDHLTADSELWNDEEYMRGCLDDIKSVLANSSKYVDGATAVYLRFNPDIFINEPGVVLVDRNGEFVESTPTNLSDYSPDDEAVSWYYEPIKAGGAYWTKPYYDVNQKKRMISYIIPVFRGNIVVGVVGMDMNFVFIEKCVNDVSVYDTGYAFIISENGDIIHHKDFPEGLSAADYDNDLISLGELLTGEKDEGLISKYSWRGDEKQLTYSRLENGMYLAITASSIEIDRSLYKQITRSVIMLIGVLAIVAVLGVSLVKKITRPLVELTAAAQEVAKGNWDAEIKSSGKDEVGVLAGVFRETISELKTHVSYVSGLAFTDVMTGAENSQSYQERVSVQESEIKQRTADFSIIIMDVLNLQHVYDAYGHKSGDYIITKSSEIIKSCIKDHKLYRTGEDSFVTVLNYVADKEAEEIRRQIEDGVKDFNRSENTCPEELVIATGVARYNPQKDSCYADVYSRADIQMFHHKRLLNSRSGMLEDALKMLQMVFHKILMANFTQDNYYVIKAYDEECEADKGFCPEISKWFENFAKSGGVHEEDKAEFLKFANVKTIKERLRSGETYLSVRYRRKVREEFRWVLMEIVTGLEYTHEEQIALIYVRDIHDSYTAELEYNKNLEKISNTDTLTGLYNRHYMKKYCEDYIKLGKKNVGVVFCDLNGLKYTNDHFGHTEGDKLIYNFASILAGCFPDEMCCRMSGDEFIVCVFSKPRKDFLASVAFLKNSIIRDGRPLASVGIAWENDAESIGSLINVAEDDMYKDKQKFYEEFPMYKR